MANQIIDYGVCTPYMQFHFATGDIENNINDHRYFMSLSHNRTTKQACVFKLTIVYVPDTFSVGRPTVIDNMLVSSKGQRVWYQYGYYDCIGGRHIQYCTYSGWMNKYDCDVDISSGTLTYTVEGCAVALDLLNNPITLHAKKLGLQQIGNQSYGLSPSQIIKIHMLQDYPDKRVFYEIGKYYNQVIEEGDEDVELPDFTNVGMLDVILGTAQTAVKDDATPVRKGGLVSYSRIKAYDESDIANSDYQDFEDLKQALKHASARIVYKDGKQTVEYTDPTILTRYNKAKSKYLYHSYMSYIDDVSSLSKPFGTFYYIPKRGKAANEYIYDFGNNVKQSDVLSVSFSYDGSLALANASASKNMQADIDAEGNNIGQSQSTTNVLTLGRNSYPTLSGFNEDRFISQQELSKFMLYPVKGSITIFGQIDPNFLMDIIYLHLYINGTIHPTLSGEYMVLGVNDEISSSGFTTTLDLVRKVTDTGAELEQYVTNSSTGSAAKLQNAISNPN